MAIFQSVNLDFLMTLRITVQVRTVRRHFVQAGRRLQWRLGTDGQERKTNGSGEVGRDYGADFGVSNEEIIFFLAQVFDLSNGRSEV